VSPYGRNRVTPGTNRVSPGVSGQRSNPGSRGRVPGTLTTSSRDRVGALGASTGSQGARGGPSKYVNNNYTPPDRRPNYRSPSLGAGSLKSGGGGTGASAHSPVATMTNQNRLRRNQVGVGARSPSMASDSSKKSIRSSGYGAPA
jgi:hypothetical protein